MLLFNISHRYNPAIKNLKKATSAWEKRDKPPRKSRDDWSLDISFIGMRNLLLDCTVFP